MNIVWEQEFVYLLKIILAGICGMIIGFERKNRAKEAGIRTHFMVALGAALMMIISKYGFTDVADYAGSRGADNSRIAAQIVSGVGFLGAGMIFVQKQTVTGLTTAAGIWATAGVGMAIGSGLYILGIGASVIIVIAQILLHKNIRAFQTPKNKVIFIANVIEPDFQSYAMKEFSRMNIHVYDTYASKYAKNNSCDYKFVVEIPSNISEDGILSLFNYDCSIRDDLD